MALQPRSRPDLRGALASGAAPDPATLSIARCIHTGSAQTPFLYLRAGHASSATLFAFYNTGYFIWSLYFRHRRSVMGTYVARTGWKGAFMKDMGQAIGFYWILAQVRPSLSRGLQGTSPVPLER